MSARGWLVAAAVAIAGCGGGGTFVSLTIDRLGTGADVASIDLALDLDGRPATATLREPTGAAIAFPTSATLAIGNGEGTLTVTAIARDTAGLELARDTASTKVSASATSRLALSLRDGTATPDLGGGDDLSPTVPADMTVPLDLTTSVPADLAAPTDLTVGPDLVVLQDLAGSTATAPSAPLNVTASAGDTAASVSWSAPTSNGGAAITGYTVTASPGGVVVTTGGSTLNTTFTGLTNGTSYVFSVTATNGAGTGPASSPSTPVIPAGVPLAPTAVAATVNGVGKLSVSWTAAGANGSAVQGYVVTPSSGSTMSAASSPVTFGGLTVGTSYTFTVTAHNAIGTGPASSPSAAVAAADVPSQPQSVVATYQSDGTVFITWQAPNANYSPIIDYAVHTFGITGDYTATGTQFTRPATGLVNGTQYVFTVTPRNLAGSGSGGTSNSVTYGAASPPAAPTNFSVSGTSYAVCYNFTGSVGATSYNVYYSTIQSKVFAGTPASVTNTSSYIGSLTANVTYYVAVTAVNAQGESPPTAILSAVPDGGITQPNCPVLGLRGPAAGNSSVAAYLPSEVHHGAHR